MFLDPETHYSLSMSSKTLNMTCQLWPEILSNDLYKRPRVYKLLLSGVVNPVLATQLPSNTSTYTQSPSYEQPPWGNKDQCQSIELVSKILLSTSSLRIPALLLWWDYHWCMNRRFIWLSHAGLRWTWLLLVNIHVSTLIITMISVCETDCLIKSRSSKHASISGSIMSILAWSYD